MKLISIRISAYFVNIEKTQLHFYTILIRLIVLKIKADKA